MKEGSINDHPSGVRAAYGSLCFPVLISSTLWAYGTLVPINSDTDTLSRLGSGMPSRCGRIQKSETPSTGLG